MSEDDFRTEVNRERIYVSKPVEQAEDNGELDLSELLRTKLTKDRYTILNPTSFIGIGDKEEYSLAEQYFIYQRCMEKLWSSDAVVVDWRQPARTHGVPSEMQEAYRRGIPVFVYIGDTDPYIPMFMRVQASFITNEFSKLMKALVV